MELFDRIPLKQHKKIVAELAGKYRQLEFEAVESFAEYLLSKLRAHAPSVEQHSRRVADIIREIIDSKAVLSSDFIRTAYLTTLLHDVGKLSLPPEIAVKSGQFGSSDVPPELRNHPRRSVELIKQESTRWPGLQTAILDRKLISLDGILHHHERLDGTGYPEGRKGNDIHLLAKLIHAVDAFDRLTFSEEGNNGSIIEAYVTVEAAGVYDPGIVALLGNYVVQKTSSAERPDVGGLTAAIDISLNRYVRLAQSKLRQDPELIKHYHRLESASAKEKGEIIRKMSDTLASLLGLPFPCTRNIVLKLCNLPLFEDIKPSNIIYTDDHNNIIDAYRDSKRFHETGAVGTRPHLEIMLKVNSVANLSGMPIVGYAPRKSNEKTAVKTELWYCNVVDPNTILLIN